MLSHSVSVMSSLNSTSVTSEEFLSISEEEMFAVIPQFLEDVSPLSSSPSESFLEVLSPILARAKSEQLSSVYRGKPAESEPTTSFKTKSGIKKTRNSSRKMAHSKYCHICSRKTERVDALGCNRISASPGCCKLVCKVCFVSASSAGAAAAEASFAALKQTEELFTCSHCTKSCPGNARCHVYSKVNEKRRQSARAQPA